MSEAAAGERRVMAGDAVRLAGPWRWGRLEAGRIGVIGGVLGVPIDGGSITFNTVPFRDDTHVSCSGGPATIHTEAGELRPTNDMVELRVWRFRNGMWMANNSEEYTVIVPVWEWTPKG